MICGIVEEGFITNMIQRNLRLFFSWCTAHCYWCFSVYTCSKLPDVCVCTALMRLQNSCIFKFTYIKNAYNLLKNSASKTTKRQAKLTDSCLYTSALCFNHHSDTECFLPFIHTDWLVELHMSGSWFWACRCKFH